MTYTTTTYTYGNCTVRVHRPDLTEEERTKRHKQLYKAAEVILRNCLERSRK